VIGFRFTAAVPMLDIVTDWATDVVFRFCPGYVKVPGLKLIVLEAAGGITDCPTENEEVLFDPSVTAPDSVIEKRCTAPVSVTVTGTVVLAPAPRLGITIGKVRAASATDPDPVRTLNVIVLTSTTEAADEPLLVNNKFSVN
jgi:hypothetical protein